MSKGGCTYILKLTSHSEVNHDKQYLLFFFFLDEELLQIS